MKHLVQDSRYAARALLRSRGFALTAVLTLALGIGATTAIFSIVNTILLRPVATPHPERLVVVRNAIPQYDLPNTELGAAQVEGLMERSDLFRAIGGHRPHDRNLGGTEEPVRVSGVSTVGDFFGVFAVRPHLGRLYGPDASGDGDPHVAVISHAFWERATGADPGIVGRSVQLDGGAYVVVGVLPPRFRYPRGVEVYTPLPADAAERRRGSLNMVAIARLQEGVTREQLATPLRLHGTEAGAEPPEPGSGLFAVPFVDFLLGQLRQVLLMLMAAVGLVLLIACANVASLQLVRATGRAREMAVRAALGASRGRIARQLLVESAFLAASGAVLGVLLGQLGVEALARWDPARQLGVGEVRLDAAVLAFSAAVAVAAAVLFGVGPALRGASARPYAALRSAARGASSGPGRSRFLQGAVVVQVALALVLLVGSGLLIRSLARLMSLEPGFAVEQVTTFQVSLPSAGYPAAEQRVAFFERLFERLESLPGVAAAGSTSALPFSSMTADGNPLVVRGRTPDPHGPEPHADTRIVGGEYFRAMGIPLLGGSGFGPEYHADGAPVVVIDETLANAFFPGEDPVGREIEHIFGDTPLTIVGVVGAVSHAALGEPRKATVYYPYAQVPVAWQALAVRSSMEPAALAGVVRAVVRELDPQLPLYDVSTMQRRVEGSLGARRLALGTLTAFALLSLALTTLGVYGVIRYRTTQRTREIGIRLALGAAPGAVQAMVVRQGLALAGTGIAVGVLVALLFNRALAALLFGVSPTDPMTFAAVIALLATVAGAASFLPARYAARVDPAESMRGE